MKTATSKYQSRTPDAQGFVQYTDEENETWSILINRQNEVIKGRACQEFIDGVERLDLPLDRIPQNPEVTERLQAYTGWGVEAVAAVIPPEEFFTLLANKRFPAATFIRTREELDYLQEPDIFHEVYGHCPLLTNQAYADFMEQYGKLALQCVPKDRKWLFRLFWFTIEFGLLQTDDGLRIYGGGILSSKDETIYAVENAEPERLPFDVMTALRTPYRIDLIQPVYFILEHMNLLDSLLGGDILDKVHEAQRLGDLEATTRLQQHIAEKRHA